MFRLNLRIWVNSPNKNFAIKKISKTHGWLFPNDGRNIERCRYFVYNNLNIKYTRVEKILQTRTSKSTLRVSRDNTRGEISLDFLQFYFFSRFKRPICKCRVPRNSWICLTVSSRRHFRRSISLFVIDNLATRRGEKKENVFKGRTFTNIYEHARIAFALPLRTFYYILSFPFYVIKLRVIFIYQVLP